MGRADSGVPNMSDTFDPLEAFKKFKENWEPKDELAEQAAREEARLKVTESVLADAAKLVLKRVNQVERAISDLTLVKTEFQQESMQLRADIDLVVGEFRTIREWWDEQTKIMQGMLMLMASMGFELDVDTELKELPPPTKEDLLYGDG